MKQYESIDVSGDAGIRASGKTIDEVFRNSALGMYSLITDLDLIEEKKHIHIAIEHPSLENLLIAWLNELIFHFDTYGFIAKAVTNDKFIHSGYKIQANLSGEDFIAGKHESKLLIKAATYHKLKIEKINDIWEAQVIFDI
jgi:SHS2 domain-containing protein